VDSVHPTLCRYTLLYRSCYNRAVNVEVHPETEGELQALPAAERTAMHHAFEKLEVYGDQLPFPHSSRVKGAAAQLRELQPGAGRSPWRAFYRRVGDTPVIGAIGPEARVDPRGFGRAIRAAEARLTRLEQERRRHGADPSA
jgi:hypothetical protein